MQKKLAKGIGKGSGTGARATTLTSFSCQKCGLAHHTLLARCRSCKHPRALRSAPPPSNSSTGMAPCFRANSAKFFTELGLEELEEPHPFDRAFQVEEEGPAVVPTDVPPLNPSPPPPPRSSQSIPPAPPLDGLDWKRAKLSDLIRDAELEKDKELAALYQKRYDALPVTSACITD